jgi:hypothetical protein
VKAHPEINQLMSIDRANKDEERVSALIHDGRDPQRRPHSCSGQASKSVVFYAWLCSLNADETMHAASV